jgi:hypothetical protein
MSALQGLDAGFLFTNVQANPVRENQTEGLTKWHHEEILRKPPQREGAIEFEIEKARALIRDSQRRTHEDIDNLKKSYVFPADNAVDIFLANHRALPPVLLAAASHLEDSFGPETIFNLEVSTDDDDSQTLYAVAVWHDTVQTAVEALERFEENWWLDHMTPSTKDLAFTYELA